MPMYLTTSSLKEYLFSQHFAGRRSTKSSSGHHKKRIVEPERKKRRLRNQIRHHLQHRAVTSLPSFTDPLFSEQWHLNGGASDGLDLNVAAAWRKGYTGKGVVVAILDDGLQNDHPDLVQNYDPKASTDITDNDDDPMPRNDDFHKHGTRCAGEVAATAYNEHCGVGIAYNASIGGVRMIDGAVTDAVEARALGFNSDYIDIYNACWGPDDDGKTVDGPGPLAKRAFVFGAINGRRGRGSIFIWASGNGGGHGDSCNCDGYTNNIFTLSISGATQGGRKPWYVEECSSTLATTYSSGTPGKDKGVTTVDMDRLLRPDHICTAEFAGTSAAAPLAAGICALALEANPELTWRDMQYLVVMTSRPEPLSKEEGWIVNGVKRSVSHKFGYGLLDASKMVSLAEHWISVPPQHICKSKENKADQEISISTGSVFSLESEVNGCKSTANEVRYLEHVQCKISLRFIPRGNLRISLTSPMGTQSTLLFERPHDDLTNFDDWPFLSVHFWGEKVEGTWKLQIENTGIRNMKKSGFGYFKKWQLIFYGTDINPVQPRSRKRSLADSYFATVSEAEKAVRDFDGHKVPSSLSKDILADRYDKNIMHDCDFECDYQGCYGKEPSQCIACKHYRLHDTCVSRCPPRSYASQGGVCWPCHESCETCLGPGQDSCLTCAHSYLLVADLAVCLQQCPDGYWEDNESSVCWPCAANCATCSDRADSCTSCEHHLVLHEGTCLAPCPASHYETKDYLCAKCHESCESCLGPSDSQCVTCHPSTYALDGRCVTSCPSGHYTDKKRTECMRCPVGCSTCTSASCLLCKLNWELNTKGKCMPVGSEKCNSGEYAVEQKCKTCNEACDSCYGANAGHCLTCRNPNLLQDYRCVSECSRGYYPEAGRCTRCIHGCTECVSRLNCTACAGTLKLQSSTCKTSCANGYYDDRGSCSKCYISCRSCIGPRRDQCASCPEGWKLAAGECHEECPQGFYESAGACRHCHHYCRECDGSGPLHCKSCPPRFMLDGGLCMECLGSQYYDATSGTCQACDSTCRTCSGPGQFSCTTCVRPLRLDRLNNQCVRCCSERGATNSTPATYCCHCHPDSGECINSSVAGKRRIAETGALHTAPIGYPEPSVAIVTLAVCAAAVALFIAVLMVLQAYSPREQKLKRTRTRGVEYSPLTCTDDGDVFASRIAFPTRETETERAAECEHEPLLEDST